MIGNSVSPGAAFLKTQSTANARLTEMYITDRKLESDKLGEPILWARNPDDAKKLVRTLMVDPTFKIDFLSDLTAYDNKDHEDGPKRFVLVYQLYSTELHVRVRIKCQLNEDEQANSICDVFL